MAPIKQKVNALYALASIAILMMALSHGPSAAAGPSRMTGQRQAWKFGGIGFDVPVDELDDGVVLLQHAATVKGRNPACLAEEGVAHPWSDNASFALRGVLHLLIVGIILCRLWRWSHLDDKPGKQAVASVVDTKLVPAPSGAQKPQDLRKAISAGDAALCERLLDKGADVNEEDVWGCSLLHQAASARAPAVVSLLIRNGAKVDGLDAMDEAPLHYAARSGDLDACRLLLDHGGHVDVNLLNFREETPLLVAGRAGHPAVCELLLARGGHSGGVTDTDLPLVLQVLFYARVLSSHRSY